MWQIIVDNYVVAGILVCCLLIQFVYFSRVWSALQKCKGFYPDKNKLSCNFSENETSIKEVTGFTDFNNHLVKETNEYICKNRTAVDLNTLKEIANRCTGQKYDAAVARLSFPMYIGLMGTFGGIGLGLFFLMSSGDKIEITDKSIGSFIGGVILAMLSSFSGLLLTTINNSRASSTEEIIEQGKSDYFYFLQTEVINLIPSTIQETLSQLNTTIGSLNVVFGKTISDLKETFGTITMEFGVNLKESLTSIKNTVELLDEGIQKTSENMVKQQELVDKILTPEYTETLKIIIDAVDGCTDASDKMKEAAETTLKSHQEMSKLTLDSNAKLIESKISLNDQLRTQATLQTEMTENLKSIQKTVQESNLKLGVDIQKLFDDFKAKILSSEEAFSTQILNTQTTFNNQLNIPKEIFEHITKILDRFKTFEENVNSFGKAQVDHNTNMLTTISNQINRLNAVNKQVENYLNANETNLKDMLKETDEKIRKLNEKVFHTLKSKMSEMTESFEENPLAYLKFIEKICIKMDLLSEKVIEENKESHGKIVTTIENKEFHTARNKRSTSQNGATKTTQENSRNQNDDDNPGNTGEDGENNNNISETEARNWTWKILNFFGVSEPKKKVEINGKE